MLKGKHREDIDRVSWLGLLVTLGVVYGDLGTSPLYTFSAVIGSKPVESLLGLGAFSCVIWTLTFQATIKYIIITLNADNKG